MCVCVCVYAFVIQSFFLSGRGAGVSRLRSIPNTLPRNNTHVIATPHTTMYILCLSYEGDEVSRELRTHPPTPPHKHQHTLPCSNMHASMAPHTPGYYKTIITRMNRV